MRARAVAVRALSVVLAVAAAVWALPNYGAVFVGGGSMAPALSYGDLVVLRRDTVGVRSGDIVLAQKAGWPAGILHRVDAVFVDGSVRLRGDANPLADREPVAAARLRGVVIAVVPLGRVRAFVRRLVVRWYNPASQSNSRGVDGEARVRARAALCRDGPHQAGRVLQGG